jgi:hypothetical protein
MFRIVCPPITHLCKPANLTLRCNNTETGFEAIFRGVRGTRIDVRDDIEYQLNYRVIEGQVHYQSLPVNITPVFVGDDTYVIGIPTAALNGTVTHMRMYIHNCTEEMYRSSVFTSCDTPAVPALNITEKVTISNMSLVQGNLTNQSDLYLEMAVGAPPGGSTSDEAVLDVPMQEEQPAVSDSVEETPQASADNAEQKKGFITRFFSWVKELFTRS